MSRLIDMTGQRFGKLTVIEKMPTEPYSKQSYWRCRCDCGNETEVTGDHLRRGYSKSCGCGRRGKMELQYIKNDPNWKKKRKSYAYKTCPYNEAVRCREVGCKRCGWNPKVAKARMEAMGYGD